MKDFRYQNEISVNKLKYKKVLTFALDYNFKF